MTIAQQLKIKEFPFEIKDSKGNTIYYEGSCGFWVKCKYDSNGDEIYFENSTNFWSKRENDSNGNEIYFETSNGYWLKRKYDSNGNQIYFENSYGEIKDNRPKSVTELSMDEIAKKFNVPVETLKIKK